MKKILLVFSLLCSLSTYAQSKKFTFKLGEEYSLPKKSDDLTFFGNEKDGIINLSLSKDKLTVLRFDKTTLVKSEDMEIDVPDATKNLNTETVVSFANNNNFWLYSDWDKKEGLEMLYAEKVDASGGKLANINMKVFETTKVSGEISRGFYMEKKINKFQYITDASNTKLLVKYRLQPEEKNEKLNYDKLGLQVFDDNMKKLWGNEFTMPYTEAIINTFDYTIDYYGNVYILAKVYDSEKRREEDKETGLPAYHFEVLKFTKDSKKIIQSRVNIGDYFIKQISFTATPSHELLIGGTYKKKAGTNATDGIFLLTMDASGSIKKYKNGYFELPLEELKKFEPKKTQQKMENNTEYELPFMLLRDLIVENDGAVFMAFEQFHSIESTSRPESPGNSRLTYARTYTYFYENILATRITADGKMAWLRKIPKNQIGSQVTRSFSGYNYFEEYNTRGTMGYKLISDTSGYYFLYLDNKKNMDLPDGEAPKRHMDGAGGQVMVSKIDLRGNITKELLFDTREEDIMIFPTQFHNINKNQFIGRAKLKKNLFQPLLITVN